MGAPNTQAVSLAEGFCEGYDHKQNIYNLAGLQGKHGKPRFTAEDGDRRFSYSPCQPFSLGLPKYKECDSGVAICMWTKTSFQAIGLQNERKFEFDNDYLTPMVVYTNKDSYPQWKAVVHLKCDPSKSENDGDLAFISFKDNEWTFVLTSLCSCPNACGCVDDSCPKAKGQTCRKSTALISATAVLGFVVVVGLIVFIKREKMWRRIRRQNEPNDEREALNREIIVNGYAANHIIEGPRDLPGNRIADNRGENVDA